MLSPTSAPEETFLPAWLIHRTKRHLGSISNGRLRTLLIAVLCISLGYIVTSTIIPRGDVQEQRTYLSSNGNEVLSGPVEFGYGARAAESRIKDPKDANTDTVPPTLSHALQSSTCDYPTLMKEYLFS